MISSKLRPIAAITKKLTLRNIRKNLTTPESKKALTLYGSQVFGLLFSFIAQKLNTKFLATPEDYGIVTACLAIFTFVYTFFEFGVFSSGARMLARAETEDEMRQIWGTLCVVSFAISLSFSILLGISSILFDSLFPIPGVKNAMIAASLLAWVFPLQYFFQETIPGSQKMYHLSIYNILSKLLYATGLLIIVNILSLGAILSLLLNLGAMAVSGITVIILLKPKLRSWRNRTPELIAEIKEFGIHVYIGRMFSLPAFNLAGMLVPFLGGSAASAYFSVGGNIASPMTQASQAIATTLYKNFSTQKRLKNRLILINFGVLFIIGSAIYLGAPTLIHIAANEKYYAAIPLMFPLVLAGFFQGFYQPFNIFVTAHGRGKWARQVSMVGTIFDICSCIILIPLFGLIGACWQSVASRAFWLLLCLYNYRRTVKLLAEMP
ncbi:hypothetical protein MASR2M18_08440 [Ignavibacteria bacterium]|nr:oligosaccharide flippase family protein [Bacteroidota bacterium]